MKGRCKGGDIGEYENNKGRGPALGENHINLEVKKREETLER